MARQVRLPAELLDALRIAAQAAGTNVHAYMVHAITAAVVRDQSKIREWKQQQKTVKELGK